MELCSDELAKQLTHNTSITIFQKTIELRRIMKKLFKPFIGLLLLLGSALAPAAPQNIITGIYSDMTFNQEGGDVVGVEIFVIFSRAGYFVVFQDAEGSPSEPVVVPAKIKNNEITFVLPARNGYSGNFRGRIGNGSLTGKFNSGQLSSSGTGEFKLRRKLSYWQ